MDECPMIAGQEGQLNWFGSQMSVESTADFAFASGFWSPAGIAETASSESKWRGDDLHLSHSSNAFTCSFFIKICFWCRRGFFIDASFLCTGFGFIFDVQLEEGGGYIGKNVTVQRLVFFDERGFRSWIYKSIGVVIHEKLLEHLLSVISTNNNIFSTTTTTTTTTTTNNNSNNSNNNNSNNNNSNKSNKSNNSNDDDDGPKCPKFQTI